MNFGIGWISNPFVDISHKLYSCIFSSFFELLSKSGMSLDGDLLPVYSFKKQKFAAPEHVHVM